MEAVLQRYLGYACCCVSPCSEQTPMAVLPVPVPTYTLCLFPKLLQVGSSEKLAQAVKQLAWCSVGCLVEPGIELQSAISQALAPSRRPVPPPPFTPLTSQQTAASCVLGQLLLHCCLTSILQMFEVPFPPCLCELQQSASGILPMQRGGRRTVVLTLSFHNKGLCRAVKNLFIRRT